MKSTARFAAFSAALCVLASTAEAALLVDYDMSGIPAGTTTTRVPATFVASDALAYDITRGPGLTAIAAASSIDSSGWTTLDAPDPDDFYQFTVTPMPGQLLDLRELAFTARRSAAGPRGFEVRFGLGGFGSGNVITLAPQALSDTTDNFRETIDLSSIPGLQGLVSTTFVRIYAFGAEDERGTFRLGVDPSSADGNLPANVQLFYGGPRSVPEPSTLVLAGLGGLMLIGFGWRRGRRSVAVAGR